MSAKPSALSSSESNSDSEYVDVPYAAKYRKMVSTETAIVCGITAAVATVIGILIGHFAINQSLSDDVQQKLDLIENLTKSQFSSHDRVSARIIADVNAGNIKEQLRFLSLKPHVVSSERDIELANHVKDSWLKQGLDHAEMVPYDVLLSFPDLEQGNKVQVVGSEGQIFFTAAVKELSNVEFTDVIKAYLAYTPAAEATGDLVYVNYGSEEDFDLLEKLGVNVSGKICIAKYGKIFRGKKVSFAEERGAAGVLLYLDPDDVAPYGTDYVHVYPNSQWMPGDAIQRGNTRVEPGDALTPGYPALDGVYRYPKDEIDFIRIPAQPINYNDAKYLLEILGGQEAPESWRGGFNMTYRIGPGFDAENQDKKVKLSIKNELKKTTIYNVVGWIKGSVEPDRYVLLGNHRDAWANGAIDPSSGTAVMIELTRVLGKLHKEGWTPRRTLIFCSWAAEEQALTGSTEWVEENFNQLYNRAIAYFNVDIAVMGHLFTADGSPLLADAITKASSWIPDPNNKGRTLYEAWTEYYNSLEDPGKPDLSLPGSSSDHAPFYFFAGIPISNLYWVSKKSNPFAQIYPAYHTAYDTFDYASKFFDPSFVFHQAAARLFGLLLHYVADSSIIPYNLKDYSRKIENAVTDMKDNGIRKKLNSYNISTDFLQEASLIFSTAAETWHDHLKTIDIHNPLVLRQVNDQMMMIERIFIIRNGLSRKHHDRHILFSPSVHTSPSKVFPVLNDLLYGIEKLSEEELRVRKQQMEIHVSDLVIALRAAAGFLDVSFSVQKR